MIELKNIVKEFSDNGKDVHAVNGVSLTIDDGDIYGIIGFSGAGKSTLVRCINLLGRPTSGEVLTRRFTHGLNEKKSGEGLSSFGMFPELILMDGGRGQVNIALEVLKELKIDIPVCGMVKDDHHRTRGLYYNNQELPIDSHSELFKLITRIQDETHRFAIEYHKSLRGKEQLHSILNDIPGIGEVRRKALLRYFKDIKAISEADTAELAKADGMNIAAAQRVYEFFRKKQ